MDRRSHPESFGGRATRAAELRAAIAEWSKNLTVEEVVETCNLMRIPSAVIGNGATITELDHFVERGTFLHNPAGFTQPRRPTSPTR